MTTVQVAPVVLAAPATEAVVLEHAVVVQATFELAGLGASRCCRLAWRPRSRPC